MTEQLHFHFLLSCIGKGNGNPLHCFCLENPRDGRAWWAAVYGVAQSRTQLKGFSSSSSSTQSSSFQRSSHRMTILFLVHSSIHPSFCPTTHLSISLSYIQSVIHPVAMFSISRFIYAIKNQAATHPLTHLSIQPTACRIYARVCGYRNKYELLPPQPR